MPELTTAPVMAITGDDILLGRDGAAPGVKKFLVSDLATWLEENVELLPDPTGNPNKLLAVNEAGTGYELIDAPTAGAGGFTPPATAGQAGKVLKVNPEGTAYILADDETGEGGGGGEYDGPDHVFLSQAAYDALDPPDENTLYFIPE